jgi:hypothetical protein
MRASIIWAWHFGQAGRSIAASGTIDDNSWGWGMMLPSNRRQCNALDYRACPQGRAAMLQYAVPAIGSLFNIAQSPKAPFTFFSSNLFFSKKKDRAAFAGGPSQGGNAPGKGSDSGGWGGG